jgi:tRNA(Ile)-lysidine synthetase-like protein
MMDSTWFNNPQWWFSGCDHDDTIVSMFGHLMEDENDEDELNKMNLILKYDQLPRHLYRKEHALHIIAYFLQKALFYSHTINLDNLDDKRFCFALLPRRHTMEVNEIRSALSLVWKRLDSNNVRASDMLKRFLKATYLHFPCVPPSKSISESFDNKILANNPSCPPMKILKTEDHFGLLASVKLEEILPANKIVISLSGGVDSMLCSWILYNSFPKDRLIAIHINYHNRDSSDDEARFVNWWCHELGIPCYIRKIDEINRPQCMKHGLREMYEEYTKKVRFNCYRMFKDAVIVLGHNKDDVLENIFTNISKQRYDDMQGMKRYNVIDGLRFWRPLLDIPKQHIIDCSLHYNIPYLPNSTPTWSMRGKIRSSVIPCLDEWNPEFAKSLFHLADSMHTLHATVGCLVDTIIRTETKINDSEMSFTSEVLPLDAWFWHAFFKKLRLYNISKKSIANICTKVKSASTKPIKVVVSKFASMLIHPTYNDKYIITIKLSSTFTEGIHQSSDDKNCNPNDSNDRDNV